MKRARQGDDRGRLRLDPVTGWQSDKAQHRLKQETPHLQRAPSVSWCG